MAGTPRSSILTDHAFFHVTWQCHNKDFLLKSDWAKQLYYDLLVKYKNTYGILIFSYNFMSNHPHLTGYCQNQKLFSDFFRVVNSCFAKAYNKKKNRRGQVVMDRFRSPQIHTGLDLLKVMHYIDLNPIRSKMVAHPGDYKWSSFHHYAYGAHDPLLDECPVYIELGTSPEERQRKYREMVEFVLEKDREKKNYSSVYFIGNPAWVKVKMEELQKQKKEHVAKWKKQHQELYSTPPPREIILR